MTPATKLQSLYNKLYIRLREYIWDFKTVETLADLEVSVYRRFPSKEEVEKYFYRLKKDIMSAEVYREDEDLQNAVINFENQLDDTDQFYAELTTFREVVDTDENDNQEELEDTEFITESEEQSEEDEKLDSE